MPRAIGPADCLARDFAFALLIGALIGLEREKRKSLEQDHSIGGIRTFILFAQTGAMAAWLSRGSTRRGLSPRPPPASGARDRRLRCQARAVAPRSA